MRGRRRNTAGWATCLSYERRWKTAPTGSEAACGDARADREQRLGRFDRSRRAWLAIALAAYCGVCSAGAFEVSAELRDAEGAPYLQIELKNASSRVVSIYRNSLPWLDRPGNFVLKGFRLDGTLSELPTGGRLHHQLGTHELRPGQSQHGRIDLCGRVERLDQESALQPLVFLWVYTPRSPDDKMAAHSGSFVVQGATHCDGHR